MAIVVPRSRMEHVQIVQNGQAIQTVLNSRGLRAVGACEQRRARAAILTAPEARRPIGRGEEHLRIFVWFGWREEEKVVEVIARKSVFRAHPAVRRILGGKEPPRRRQIITLETLRQVQNHVNVEVIDALADVFPTLAAIEASYNAAVLDAEINETRAIGMDKN